MMTNRELLEWIKKQPLIDTIGDHPVIDAKESSRWFDQFGLRYSFITYSESIIARPTSENIQLIKDALKASFPVFDHGSLPDWPIYLLARTNENNRYINIDIHANCKIKASMRIIVIDDDGYQINKGDYKNNAIQV
jgi:hypothetical protein